MDNPTFYQDPLRIASYASALSYWPGKFCEHAIIGDSIKRNGYKTVIDSGGAETMTPFAHGATITSANPDINGINGADLPFADNSFDLGISTHTLEHVKMHEREAFLDELIRVSKHEVILIFPLGEANAIIDNAKTEFVGNMHQHDENPQVTAEWLYSYLNDRKLAFMKTGLFNRAVHFMLAMLLPIDSDRKRDICKWINTRYDVSPDLGDPYDVMVEILK